MIVAFMVGWTPYAAFSILVTANPTIHLDPRLAAIPAFFSKTATVYNPIIYVFMNRQVTESFIITQVKIYDFFLFRFWLFGSNFLRRTEACHCMW